MSPWNCRCSLANSSELFLLAQLQYSRDKSCPQVVPSPYSAYAHAHCSRVFSKFCDQAVFPWENSHEAKIRKGCWTKLRMMLIGIIINRKFAFVTVCELVTSFTVFSSTNAEVPLPSWMLVKCQFRFLSAISAEFVRVSCSHWQHGLGPKRHTKTKKCSIVDTEGRPENWVLTLGGPRRLAVDPRPDPASLHLWASSGGCRDRLSSRHTPYVRIVQESKWCSCNNRRL